MRLPNEDWLHLAKGTAVGTQRRARHRREGRDNLIVGNAPDRWWAYCQACRAGGVEMKQHVMVGSAPPPESTSLVLPHDARAIADLQGYEVDALTLLLARKSMDWMYFTRPVTWSLSRQRLIIHTETGAMGRDTTERSPQKWLTYDRQHYLKAETTHRNVLLVEDTFSMYKVAFALKAANLPMSVACTLGTSIHDSLFYSLTRYAANVWSFYDGDTAGWKGAARNAQRLQALDLLGPGGFIEVCAPTGKDPKDMDLRDIAAHAARLLTTFKEKPQ